jgi:hypothetical protein
MIVRAAPSVIDSENVVKRLGTIHADTDHDLVLEKCVRPFAIQQRCVGLDTEIESRHSVERGSNTHAPLIELSGAHETRFTPVEVNMDVVLTGA